jgi:phospholipid/cholesterol/gamma-HCH transport system substrate-binding protein
MIRRSVKFQLVAFALISLLGVFYVGANYVGINFLSDGPYSVRLVLPASGGIFPNAEVTERGVTVGRVGSLDAEQDSESCGTLDHCVVVTLKIDPEHDEIPADLHATVANKSAVGEQYVDLAPATASGPFLKNGDVIEAKDATIPLDTGTLLLDLDDLVNSVDKEDLATVIEELGTGFADLGPSLQRLIDNGNLLTQAAIETLPQQLQLIDDSKTVLDTQNDVAEQFKAWAASLASFSQQLKQSDPDLRGVFDNGVKASRELTTLLQANAPVLPTLLGNLVTFNRIQAVRLPYVRATLSLFPALTAAGYYVTPGDGTAHFGQVNDDNPPCYGPGLGYDSTRLRGNNDDGSHPSDWGGPANLDAYCKAPKAEDINNRGSRFIPRSNPDANVTNSDPYPGPRYGRTNHPTVAEQERGGYTSGDYGGGPSGSPGAAAAGGETVIPRPYDPLTGLLTGLDGKKYQLGYSGPLEPIFGSSSWEWLLIAPTMR